ncbi:MAG: 5-formyltetrahydrofolate cyclo-ligase [Alicyclobacillus macrosporangiidus]|uniref:5-formyltetrahydrofolate cyclo-ligase n=1 Tax=Alicyclobacillus macrosporangiidus TaxID=392015 RepID=UPI0026EAE939|nr:5-formyltetrahydrofolate cyclo-ligase [Alicyclobacillus macrosporangiidus]MCL6597825.1 5-formyltetrahydrofolate cyclo-ligase [Alicyclobacillus macrosporangiidus]
MIDEKTRLRRRYLAVRQAWSEFRRAEASAVICARLVACVADLCRTGRLPVPPGAGAAVALYQAVRGEVDVSGAAVKLAEAGWRVAYPVTDGPRMAFYHAARPDAWRTGRFGIREPDPAAGAERVDPARLAAVVVPGVAFTAGGHRLGYGGGYYDRWFAEEGSAEGAAPVRIGVCFSCQMAPWLPVDAHDQRVDLVVTEEGVIPCSSGR